MWKVTLRDIREHFGRFLMTVLAVSLGVAFLSGTLSLRDLLGSTFSSLTESTTMTDLTVSGKPIEMPGGFGELPGPVDPALEDEVAEIEGVAEVYPDYFGNAFVYDDEGKPANMNPAPALGFSFIEGLQSSDLIEGEAPEPGEIALEESTATRSGIAVGDTVVVVVHEPVEMRVSGIVTFGASMAGASITMFHPDEANDLFGPQLANLLVNVSDAGDLETVRDRIQGVVGENYEVKTAAEVTEEANEMIGTILNFVNTFLLIFVGVALGISIFIITNTFTISVRQRQKQFALLRALGSSPRQIFGVVLLQALVIGFVGSLLGVLFGQGLLMAIRAGIEAMGMPLSGSVIMNPDTIAISIAIGMIVTMLATLVPSYRAAQIAPIEAMRESGGQAEKPLRTRTILALLVLLAGGVMLFLGAGFIEGTRNGMLLGIGALLLVIGLLLVMPALVQPVVSVLGWPWRKAFPTTGVLASRSLMAGPRKTATTAAALAIGVALVSAGATMAASLKSTIDDQVDDSISIDLLALPRTSVTNPQPARELLEGVEGVESVDASDTRGFIEILPDGGGNLIGTQSPELREQLGVTATAGDLGAIDRGEAVVAQYVAEANGWAVGDTISVRGGTGPVDLVIGAIVESGSLIFQDAAVSVNRELFDHIQPIQPFVSFLVINVADGANVTDVQDRLQAAVADQYMWDILDQDGIKDLGAQQINSVLTFLYALLALSIIIAVLGIINTLTLSVVDRVREFGLLRAVGLQRGGVRAMIVQESIMTTLLGALTGLILGVALGLGVISYLSEDGDVSFVIPWPTVGMMLVVAFIVGILAAYFPARRAGKLNVLEAIATD